VAATILIVEDEFAVARGIQYALQQEGYQVAIARSGEEGLEFATNQAPDLVVLDVRLPGMDGFEVLRRLRANGSKAPVLVLTARDDEVDKVIGLELGADDYLTKPFGLRELMSRIRALLRRAYGDLADAAGGRVIRHRDLVIDLERQRVQRGQRQIALTPTEFEILRHLATSGPCSPAASCRAAARLQGLARTRRRSRHVSLRDKIEDDPASPRASDGPGVGCAFAERDGRLAAAGPVLPARRIAPGRSGPATLRFVGVVALTVLVSGLGHFSQQRTGLRPRLTCPLHGQAGSAGCGRSSTGGRLNRWSPRSGDERRSGRPLGQRTAFGVGR
jgi:DNA-binding response OmpR family regulator